LAEALELYSNDFLSGFSLPESPAFDDWQFFQSEEQRDALASALERLVEGHATLDQYDRDIAYARRWLALDPLHEPVHRWLMQLYAWDGRQGAAMRQYDACARLLVQEMDVPPAPETEQLYQAIKARRLSPLLAHCDDSAATTERLPEDDIRVVTVLSVGLADDVTPDSANALELLAEATRRLLSIVEEACAPYAGRIEQVAGEVFLVIFGVDQVHEDDAERGVRAAIAIRLWVSLVAAGCCSSVSIGQKAANRMGNWLRSLEP
jgi:hypothetical protein